jgi:dynein heavy chain
LPHAAPPAAAAAAVQIDDAIMEALENDNLQLQNMSGQKYVQLNPMFQDAVANWQKKLGTVDSVLATWGDVQKKWQALESIFVGSADIRVQLPEDSKRFDVLNADYQDLMRNACDVTNVVEAANADGRQDRLENMLLQLEQCQKALQVWQLMIQGYCQCVVKLDVEPGMSPLLRMHGMLTAMN